MSNAARAFTIEDEPRSPGNSGLPASGLPVSGLHERLEQARSGIEERFLAGGAALVSAHEMVRQLLGALEGIVAALDASGASSSMLRLHDAVAGLEARTEAEKMRQTGLDALVRVGAAITPHITEMRGTLRYLATCATATKITGAGIEEFVGFANEIALYVKDADDQVVRFNERVGEINHQLDDASSLGRHTVSTITSLVPEVCSTLLASMHALEKRGSDLGKAAARAANLTRSIQGKFTGVLSALQVGDMTRQRIEHVQTALSLYQRMTATMPDPELEAACGRIAYEQIAALLEDFSSQTRQVVSSIHGLADDARMILALHVSMSDALGHNGGGDPLAVVEGSITAARKIVIEIERAAARAAEAQFATRMLADDLLDNAGNIGNLKNVRDDIRCLAINAYLRCSRMGELGRSVGVIATEMSLAGERLGGAAEGILARLAEVRARADEMDTRSEETDPSGELAEVLATLRRAHRETAGHVAEISRQGDTIVSRIAEVSSDLDFSSSLGDTLADCRNMLKIFSSTNTSVSEKIEDFSKQVFSLYTMKSERETHSMVFPDISDFVMQNNTYENSKKDEEIFDDFLL